MPSPTVAPPSGALEPRNGLGAAPPDPRATPSRLRRRLASAAAPLFIGLFAAQLSAAIEIVGGAPPADDPGALIAGPDREWHSLPCGAEFETRLEGAPHAGGPADTHVELRCPPAGDGRDVSPLDEPKQIVTETKLDGGLVLRRRCDVTPPDLTSYCGNAHVAQLVCDASVYYQAPPPGAEAGAPLMFHKLDVFAHREGPDRWRLSASWSPEHRVTVVVEAQGPARPVLVTRQAPSLPPPARHALYAFAAAAFAFAGGRRLGARSARQRAGGT